MPRHAALRFHRCQLRGRRILDLAADVHLPKIPDGRLGIFEHVNRVAPGQSGRALCGGVLADRAARRSKGGRIRVQGSAWFSEPRSCSWQGGPHRSGWWSPLSAAGLFKGVYDANIFASLFDVIDPEDRGTAAGLMNSLGWTGGFLAPAAVGLGSERFGLSLSIASTAAVYVLVGLLAFVAARLAEGRASRPGIDLHVQKEGSSS